MISGQPEASKSHYINFKQSGRLEETVNMVYVTYDPLELWHGELKLKHLFLIDWFKITADVNTVDELNDFPKEKSGNMKCVEMQEQIFSLGLCNILASTVITIKKQDACSMYVFIWSCNLKCGE